MEVLCRFLRQYVDGIIDGNDTHQPVFLVQNGKRGKIVTIEEFRCDLPVIRRVYGNHVFFHDFSHGGMLFTKKHFPHRDHTDQFLPLFCHIAGIHIFSIVSMRLNPTNGIQHGHVFFELDELGGHHRTGAVIRILQQLIHLFPGFRADMRKHISDHIGRHFFQQVYGIIRIHLLQHILYFLRRKIGEKLLLLGRLHLTERLCGKVFWQNTKKNNPGFVRNLSQNFRHIHRLQFEKFLFECRQIMVF